jgi:hypothetical protein
VSTDKQQGYRNGGNKTRSIYFTAKIVRRHEKEGKRDTKQNNKRKKKVSKKKKPQISSKLPYTA